MRLYVILMILCAVFFAVISPASVANGAENSIETLDPEKEKTNAHEKRIADLEELVARLESGNIRLEAEKVRAEEAAKGFAKEADRLKNEVEHLRSESAKLSVELTKTRAELEKAAGSLKMTISELEKEKAAHAEKDVRLTEEKAQKAALLKEKRLLEQETLRLKSDISGLETGREQVLKTAYEQDAAMRSELLDTLARLGDRDERLKRYERSAASIIETLSPVYLSVREIELGDDLELVTSSGLKLASKSADVCSTVLSKLKSFNMDPVAEAKLRVMLEELSGLVGSFARLAESGRDDAALKSCRILEVDDALGAVIIGAGYRDGVRVNMSLVPDGIEGVSLRVVALRPFVSAAIPDSGTVKRFAPGMTLRASLEGK